MKILLATSELYPYSKTGGLADMVGSLSKRLASSGTHGAPNDDIPVCRHAVGDGLIPARHVAQPLGPERIGPAKRLQTAVSDRHRSISRRGVGDSEVSGTLECLDASLLGPAESPGTGWRVAAADDYCAVRRDSQRTARTAIRCRTQPLHASVASPTEGLGAVRALALAYDNAAVVGDIVGEAHEGTARKVTKRKEERRSLARGERHTLRCRDQQCCQGATREPRPGHNHECQPSRARGGIIHAGLDQNKRPIAARRMAGLCHPVDLTPQSGVAELRTRT